MNTRDRLPTGRDWFGEFPLDESLIYLNHAGVGPWPLCTAAAIHAFTDENLHRGAADYPRWLEIEQRLRNRLARLLNAPGTSDIALVKNTSEALSFVAMGLDWHAGDNVVLPSIEFPSNRIVWQALAPRGVDARLVDLDAAECPEDALLAALDARTRVLAVSAVQYSNGLRLDLARLGTACRERGILFCVDAIQQLGAAPLDVQHIDASFAMADGHKWLLAPEGLGVFYCKESLRNQLHLTQFGWHMAAEMYAFDSREWRPADSARRFECGSPNMLGVHALESSVALLQDIGLDEIQQLIRHLTDQLIARIDAEDRLELHSPRAPGQRAGIVCLRVRGLDSAPIYEELMRRGVICAHRGGSIRLSPHFYTPPAHLESAVDTILEIASAAG